MDGFPESSPLGGGLNEILQDLKTSENKGKEGGKASPTHPPAHPGRRVHSMFGSQESSDWSRGSEVGGPMGVERKGGEAK